MAIKKSSFFLFVSILFYSTLNALPTDGYFKVVSGPYRDRLRNNVVRYEKTIDRFQAIAYPNRPLLWPWSGEIWLVGVVIDQKREQYVMLASWLLPAALRSYE